MSTFEALLDKAQGRLPPDLRRGGKAYDLFAAMPLIVWYGFSTVGRFGVIADDLSRFDLSRPDPALAIDVLAKLSGTLLALLFVVFLFMRRPPVAGARGFGPRLAAVLGAYLSVGILFLPMRENPMWLNLVSTLVILGGVGFAALSLSHLGRSISLMAEARALVTTGPYARIRHPLYLGEQIAIFGLLLQYLSPAAFLVVAVQCACQFYRMGFEEQVLEETFPDYAAYREKTWRLLPGVY